MSLTGELVDENTFTHNNMDPYFGGNIRQNMDIDRNAVLLENFTGVSDIPKQKCEVKTFYDKSKDMGNVFGVSNNNDYYRDRIEQPRLRNNEVPIEQIRVGPGLNQGYTAKPVGGFQQFEDGEIARAGEKCVDQLRVKTNPKETFKGRNVDGMKAKLPFAHSNGKLINMFEFNILKYNDEIVETNQNINILNLLKNNNINESKYFYFINKLSSKIINDKIFIY
jgi:hypothetical protein